MLPPLTTGPLVLTSTALATVCGAGVPLRAVLAVLAAPMTFLLAGAPFFFSFGRRAFFGDVDPFHRWSRSSILFGWLTSGARDERAGIGGGELPGVSGADHAVDRFDSAPAAGGSPGWHPADIPIDFRVCRTGINRPAGAGGAARLFALRSRCALRGTTGGQSVSAGAGAGTPVGNRSGGARLRRWRRAVTTANCGFWRRGAPCPGYGWRQDWGWSGWSAQSVVYWRASCHDRASFGDPRAGISLSRRDCRFTRPRSDDRARPKTGCSGFQRLRQNHFAVAPQRYLCCCTSTVLCDLLGAKFCSMAGQPPTTTAPSTLGGGGSVWCCKNRTINCLPQPSNRMSRLGR